MNVIWTLPAERLILVEVKTTSLKPDIWCQGKIDFYEETLVDDAVIEAPIIALESKDDIMFVNGIHRTAVAISKGLETLKIAVLAEEAEQIRNICQRASF